MSDLVADIEVAAAGSWAGRAKVGQDDGWQHAAPARLHDHNAEDLALGLRDYNLQRHACTY